MNKLIITAHPSSKSFTSQIANRYKDLSLKNNDKVEVLDLYKTDLKQWFLEFEDMSDLKPNDTILKIQEKIKWADELTFIFPIWWADSPAILKNFIDNNFTAWFAFNYVNWKPEWLLKWKQARLYVTSWAPSFMYTIFPISMRILWWWTRLWFCWIKLKEVISFWKMDSNKNPQDREKMLEKVRI